MAALAGMLAKSMAKGMAKSAAREAKSEARNLAKDLKREAKDLAYDLKNQTKAAATNYLDAKKNRIYQTTSNAFYTKTGGGRNYSPTPAYRNVVGTNTVTPLY
jgi:ADP-heptose:LPS heptosyltransferase